LLKVNKVNGSTKKNLLKLDVSAKRKHAIHNWENWQRRLICAPILRVKRRE
jgi:hypothetical protein